MAEASGFQLVEALTDLVRNLFSAVGQTSCDENGFRAQRFAEEGSYHRSLSDKRKWATLINSKVAKQRFRYDELPNFMNCQPSTPKLKEVMGTSHTSMALAGAEERGRPRCRHRFVAGHAGA